MSFQAYLDNIQAKTGKTPADFRRLATQKGFAERGKLRVGVKAGAVVAWLKADFELGDGHAMAIGAPQRQEGGLARQVSQQDLTFRFLQLAPPIDAELVRSGRCETREQAPRKTRGAPPKQYGLSSEFW